MLVKKFHGTRVLVMVDDMPLISRTTIEIKSLPTPIGIELKVIATI